MKKDSNKGIIIKIMAIKIINNKRYITQTETLKT